MILRKIIMVGLFSIPSIAFATNNFDANSIKNEAMKKVVEIDIEGKLNLTDTQKYRFRDEIIKYNKNNLERENVKKIKLEKINEEDKKEYSKIINKFNRNTDKILLKDQKEKMISYQNKIKENNDIANKKAEKIKEKLYQQRLMENNVQSYDTLK